MTSIYYHVPLYPVPVYQLEHNIKKIINKGKIITCAGPSGVLEPSADEI